jgi:hypothetical protein
MTEATRSAAGSALSTHEPESRGSRRFKNVAQPLALYALTLASSTEGRQPPDRSGLPDGGRPESISEKRTHERIEFLFCSRKCAEVFDRHPERYAGVHSGAG